MKNSWPLLGCGVGLRNVHYGHVTSKWPEMDFFEVISENFMDSGGRPIEILETVRKTYPVVLHGTSLSIASTDSLNDGYLAKLKILVDRIQPEIVSDHLCWCGVDGEQLHDLLPLPYTEEALNHTVQKVEQVQNYLGRPILLENVSTYLTYTESVIPEWEFISEVAKRSGCGILLDVNNIYVNAFNHQFDPMTFLDAIPGEKIGQIHLAGHTDKGKFLFDTHTGCVIDEVWKLYEEVLNRFGKVTTLIEWDEDVPEFNVLQEEAARARVFYEKAGEELPDQTQSAVPLIITEQSESPKRLVEIQRWMKDKIQPIKNEAEGRQNIEVALHKQGGDPGEERLTVYSDGYLARILESLKESYPAISHVLGERLTAQLANDYAATYPSHDYNLSMAGRHLPHFLLTWKKTEDLPFLPDLAKMEWMISVAFHAHHKQKMDSSAFTSLGEEEWEKAKLELQPSVFVMNSDWPILDIWESRKKPVDEIYIELENRPQKVLIYRQGTDVFCELLETGPFQVLSGILKRKRVGQICEELMRIETEEIPPIAEWFARWSQLGLFADFTVDSSS